MLYNCNFTTGRGSNDEYDHSFEIVDEFDLGKTCAISHPETVF
jgi:hypothetical protein